MAEPRDQRYVIMLAYHFPPMVGAPSQRVANFARHLPELGWTPIIVTARSGLFHRDEREQAPAVRVERTPSPEPAQALRRLRRAGGETDGSPSAEVGAAAASGVSRVARRIVRDWVYIPDGQLGWIPFAAAAARRAIAASQGTYVLHSSSGPISAHLAARAAARSKAVPWIAEFRDPWATASQVRPRSSGRKRVDRAIESMIVRSADRVVVTAERTASEFLAAHSELEPDRISVIRNGFEPEDFDGLPPAPDEPLALVYSGTVLPHVSVEPLLEAMSRVARRRPGELTLRVVGPSGPWKAAAERVDAGNWLELQGLGPASHARVALASASVNVICRPDERDTAIVAAKMYEYLGARRPILAILADGSEMERLGRRYGDIRVVLSNDSAALEKVVEELIGEHRQGLLDRPVEPAEPLEELTWTTQVTRLAGLLDELAGARATISRRSS